MRDSSKPTSRIDRRRDEWLRLSGLLDIVERDGLISLTPGELAELGGLHRKAASHLAQAKAGPHDPGLVAYINGLVVRSHNTVYRVPSHFSAAGLARFFTSTYPRMVRKLWPFVLASAVLLYGSAFAAFLVAYTDPISARALVPAQFRSVIGPGMPVDYKERPLPEAAMPVLSSFIMQNNIKVGFMAFAGGVLGGTVTFYQLVENGVMVGGIAGGVHHYGDPLPFWVLILPHGVVELWAITLAGAAGFRLGWAVLVPGRLARGTALLRAGREAVLVALGTVALFVVAGLIEGFITPSALPDMVKLGVGGASGLLTLLYLYGPLGRRGGADAEEVLPR